MSQHLCLLQGAQTHQAGTSDGAEPACSTKISSYSYLAILHPGESFLSFLRLEFQRQNDNLLLIISIIIYYNLLVIYRHSNAQMISLESIPHRDCHPAGPCSDPCQCYLHGLTLWKSLQFLGNPFPSERLS